MRTLTFFILVAICSQVAQATKIVGNGGDRRAIEFVDIGTNVLNTLFRNRVPEINTDLLTQAIELTKIESTDEALFLNGIPKDAINYPKEKTILFNRAAWDRQSDYLSRATFVLHEYLGIMGSDDSGYKISKIILRGLWFINGTDAETMIDVLAENKFAVDEAVHGVTRMVDAEEISCDRTSLGSSTEYQCNLTGKGLKGKPLQVALTGRKAREVWTLITSFRSAPCRSDVCNMTIHKVACQGENTRMDKPGFCTAKQ